jgi:hypothetical protein
VDQERAQAEPDPAELEAEIEAAVAEVVEKVNDPGPPRPG